MALDLILKDMKDPWVRENFSRLQKYLSVQALLLADFQFFEVDIPAASGKYTLPHGMAFIPFDVLILSLTGNQSVYFHYQEFDKTNIYLTAAGPVRVRFLAGRFSQPGYEKGAVEYPLVAPATTNAVTTIAAGGTGQTTQAAAITALAGAQTNGRYLRSDGTATTLAAIQAADVPTLNQNTTGTAANITAASNSTLTTLSSLTLPAAQLSGMTAIANGGTGQNTANAALNALLPSQAANSGKLLTTNGTNTSWVASASGGNVPTGTLIEYMGSSAPTGYQIADGSAISRSTYSLLFAVIGTAFGIGDGSTTFNLPDLQGRFARGYSNTSTNDPDKTARVAQTSGTFTVASGATTSGSPTITVADTSSLAPGMTVSGTGIPASSVVRAILTSTTFTLGNLANSANVNATATNSSLTFTFSKSATGNYVGSVQVGQFTSHTHQWSMSDNAGSVANSAVASNGGAPGNGVPFSGSGTVVVTATGGNETRPINITVLHCIRDGT